MSDCQICKQLKEKELLVYEGKYSAVLLSKEPLARGHTIVVPKEHFPIVELIPDWTLSEMAGISNKISIALFEGLKAQGTNVLIPNGQPAGQIHPHCTINIIPRMEGDGLEMTWPAKQVTQDELNRIEAGLKEEAKSIQPFKIKKPQEVVMETKTQEAIVDKQDMRIQQLRRIP